MGFGQRFWTSLVILFVSITAVSAFAQDRNEKKWIEEEWREGSLHGTLTLPRSSDNAPLPIPLPAVLLVAGSGPVDRDGNMVGMPNDSLKRLAHGLAAEGVAVLRTDKRGIGASQVDIPESGYTVNLYVNDVISWIGRLRADRRLGTVAAIGHSEGAVMVTLAAKQTSVSSLVLIAGPGQRLGLIIARQLAAANVPERMQQASARIADALEKGDDVAAVPPPLLPFYRPSIQGYLKTLLPIDPAQELGKLSIPTLIIQGTSDLQITEDDAHKLTAARSDAKLVMIQGMNHILRFAPADNPMINFQTYTNPSLPLADGLVSAIAAFVKAGNLNQP